MNPIIVMVDPIPVRTVNTAFLRTTFKAWNKAVNSTKVNTMKELIYFLGAAAKDKC